MDLCVMPFEHGHSLSASRFMFNTNTGVQAQHPDFDPKVHCRNLEYWRHSLHDDAALVWSRIVSMLRESLEATADILQRKVGRVLSDPRLCFELIGVDVVIDGALQPWIVEFNRSPSLTPKYSGQLKYKLIEDLAAAVLADRELPPGEGTPSANYGDFQLLYAESG